MEYEVSRTEGGGDGLDIDWLGLRENCGVGGDVGVLLLILRGVVDSGVRLEGRGICLCAVGIIAGWEWDRDISTLEVELRGEEG